MVNITVINKQIDLKFKNHNFKNYHTHATFILLEENNNTYVIKSFIEDNGEPLSVKIAMALHEWDSDSYYNEIDYELENGDCEECGWYVDTTWTIKFSKDENDIITIFEDGHFNGSYGFLNEEIIEDWKKLGYNISIINEN